MYDHLSLQRGRDNRKSLHIFYSLKLLDCSQLHIQTLSLNISKHQATAFQNTEQKQWSHKELKSKGDFVMLQSTQSLQSFLFTHAYFQTDK